MRRAPRSSTWTRFAPALVAGCLLLVTTTSARDTSVTTDAVTLEQIMSHPDWIGNAPEGAYWSEDGKAIYYERKRRGEQQRDLWRLSLTATDAVAERVDDAELGHTETDGGQLDHQRRQKVFTRDGNLFVTDLTRGTTRQLTRNATRERSPAFLLGDRSIAFERGEALLVRELDSGLEYAPAELRLEDDPAQEDDPDYYQRQQRRLFDIVQRQRERATLDRDRSRSRRDADPTLVPSTWYLGDDVEILARTLSPTGTWMALLVDDADRREGRSDAMPNYVTDDGYVANRPLRAKVGTDAAPKHRVWLLDLESRKRIELDLGDLPSIRVDPLADLAAAAKAAREAADEAADEAAAEDETTASESSAASSDTADSETADSETAADSDTAGSDESDPPRPVTVDDYAWSPDGETLAVQLHSYDNKDRWLILVDRTGQLEVAHHLQHNDGWINWSFNEFAWLRDGRIVYLSEETGWSQLFVHDPSDGSHRRLTEGDYQVSNLEIERQERWAYFTANPDHPGHYDTYRVSLDGGPTERLTTLGGLTSSRLSPDGEQLLIRHSTTTRPPELFVQDATPGATPRQLTHTASDAFTALPWVAPEIVAVPSTHQPRPIYSRLYQPAAANPRHVGTDGKRPAVVFVHGAGYLQNAHGGWSGYFREFMFHTLLTQAGYVVLDMDYRASRGYGRDWRTAIYRQMGHPEVEDLADGVAYLAAEHGVDPSRVGVYGGSYGGFLTFMAMFRQPELFACGAALRPVTDWAHYNHPYTSNILNTPEADPEAYRRSSPIEFADGLEKPLLICAGMQDDNVFFQDTVRLVQRLIELEKEDFETAIYPIEPHGFREPSSWLDEYRRIFKLFETHLAP